MKKIHLNSRAGTYGTYALVLTAFVLGLIILLNYLGYKHPKKWDLTKNKIHTLSDQTEKVVKALDTKADLVVFAKFAAQDEIRGLLENYRILNPDKVSVEYVDPDKEFTRASQAGIKKSDTIQLRIGERTTLVDSITEEKITNAIIKLTHQRKLVFCALTGHGEREIGSTEPEGYAMFKQGLEYQNYEVKAVSLQETGKIPEDCSVIGIFGAKRAFFDKEMKLIDSYLGNGGRALVAIDYDPKARGESSPEIVKLLAKWHIQAVNAVVVDPASRMFGMDAFMALIQDYSKEHAITKDFGEKAVAPLARPLKIAPNAPKDLKVEWVARTLGTAWGEADEAEIKTGRLTQGSNDVKGPVTTVISAEGKIDPKASKAARLVAFGTSHFVTNQFARNGGNLDLILNSAAWLLEDESAISIRSRENAPANLTISQQTISLVGLFTVVVVPLGVLIGGAVQWWRRRKL